MFVTRLKLFVLGALILGLGGSTAFTQGPGGGEKKTRGFGMDPDTQFEKYAKGKDVLVVSEVEVDERFARFMPSEKVREQMNSYLTEKGISGGRMTREQFKDYSDWQRTKMMEQFSKGGFSFGQKSGEGGGDKGGGEDLDARAKERFKQSDANGDGSLTLEEVKASRSRLSGEFDKHDKNNDGKIDLAEYLDYYKAAVGGFTRGGDKGGDKGGEKGYSGRGLDDEKPKAAAPEEKYVTYRYGNLPKDLPSWYADLDKDKDGQVGLYEWRGSGKDLKDFVAMDANADGFVTVEEFYRHQKALAAKKTDGNPLLAMMPSSQQSVLGNGSAGATKGTGKGDGKSKFGWGSGDSSKGSWGGGDSGKSKGKGGWGMPKRN